MNYWPGSRFPRVTWPRRASMPRLPPAQGANLDNQVLYTRILIALKAYDDADTQLKLLEAAAPDSLPVVELRARLLTAQGKGKEGADALVRAMDGRLKTIRDIPNGERMIRLLLDLGQPEGAGEVARMVGKLGTRGKCLLAEFLASRPKPRPKPPRCFKPPPPRATRAARANRPWRSPPVPGPIPSGSALPTRCSPRPAPPSPTRSI